MKLLQSGGDVMMAKMLKIMIFGASLFWGVRLAIGQTPGAPVLFDRPMRELGLVISRDGYYPQKLAVFAGEQLRIFLATTSQESGCFVMPSKDLVLSVAPGHITEGLIYFDHAGTYPFYCPAGKIEGEVVVLARESREKNNLESKQTDLGRPMHIWRPKEE